MPAAFARGKQGNKSIYVPMRAGYVQRTTGTPDMRTVRAIQRIVQEARDEARYSGDWTLQDAVRANRLSLTEWHAAFVAGEIPQLRARLSAKNLCDHLTGWRAWVQAGRDGETRTHEVYWQQVTTLIPEGGTFLAPDLTKASVMAWLTGRDGVSSGTRRKYLYALKSFVRYLLDTGILATDPLAGLKAPKKNATRIRYESEAVDRRIVDAADRKYRALFAFLKATGADVSTAFRTLRRDLDLERGRATIRGTKTGRRHVHEGEIEAWALPILREYVAGLLPNAFCWPRAPKHAEKRGRAFAPGYSRSGAYHHHAECCEAVGVEDYTLKDARHSVAVRMRKAGRTFEEIADQLGNSVYQVATIYARFQPETTTNRTTRPASGPTLHEAANG